jgi:hypothetical protein
MGMSKEEPAFPCTLVVGAAGKAGPIHHQFAGMSMRDYFAAQALPMLGGMLTALRKLGKKRGLTLPDAVAQAAYNYADAMLKARNE